jgi:amidase
MGKQLLLGKERSKAYDSSPLHGIPILIKNNIATKDEMNNTGKFSALVPRSVRSRVQAGSWALLGATVPRDATVAQRLRGAGAILLGKTGMSEWANFRSLNTSNGWSALGGQVMGPYFPSEDPWGSSSGSAVAAA